MTYGSEYIISPIPESLTGSVITVLSLYAGTQVQASNTPDFILTRPAEYAPIQITGYTRVAADQPVVVAQYVNSPFTAQGSLDQPAMVMIPPTQQYKKDYVFIIPQGMTRNYVMLIVLVQYQTGLIIDGVQQLSLNWTRVPDTMYIGSYTTLTPGQHRIYHLNPGVSFGAYVYGHSDQCGYAYAAGTCLKSIVTVSCISHSFHSHKCKHSQSGSM